MKVVRNIVEGVKFTFTTMVRSVLVGHGVRVLLKYTG